MTKATIRCECGHDGADHDPLCNCCECETMTPRASTEPACPVPYVDICHETAYGTTTRLPFMVRVF